MLNLNLTLLIPLIPLAVALVLLFISRNYIISVFVAVFSGVLILNNGNLIQSAISVVRDYLYLPLTDPYKASAITFIIFYCGYVGTIENTGSITGLSKFLLKRAKNKRQLQLYAFLSGALVFFSDLGAPMVVGHVFRPAFDDAKVPREKLAWIINASAAPICCMVPIVGWGIVAMAIIKNQFSMLNYIENEWVAYISSFSYFFFPILIIILALLTILSGRDFDPMLKAEKRVTEKGKFYWDGSNSEEKPSSMGMVEGKAKVLWISLTALLATFIGLLFYNGFPLNELDSVTILTALGVAFIVGSAIAILLLHVYGIINYKEAFETFTRCFYKRTVTVTALMVLSWAFGAICNELGTDLLVSSFISKIMPFWSIPALLFLISIIISYVIGSAWSTFGIVFPFAIPMAITNEISIYICIGAVISGAIYGDFSSRVSHSPSLASRSAWCDVKDLLIVQKPYVILAGAVSLSMYLMAVLINSYITLLIGIFILVCCFFVCTKKAYIENHNKQLD